MNEASKELCEELYELTGWADSSMYVVDWPDGKRFPRYDLGFLQRKLRDYAENYNGEGLSDIAMSLEPENDYARLAITLANQGLLPKGGEKS